MPAQSSDDVGKPWRNVSHGASGPAAEDTRTKTRCPAGPGMREPPPHQSATRALTPWPPPPGRARG